MATNTNTMMTAPKAPRGSSEKEIGWNNCECWVSHDGDITNIPRMMEAVEKKFFQTMIITDEANIMIASKGKLTKEDMVLVKEKVLQSNSKAKLVARLHKKLANKK